MAARRGHGLVRDIQCGVRQAGEDAAGVEPAHPGGEHGVPVDVPFAQLGDGGVGAVADTEGAADAVAAFDEVEAVAGAAADPVVRCPADQRGVDAALEDQVLDEPAHGVVGEGGHDGCAQAEAAAQASYDVVLAAALPDLEGAGGSDPSLARIEAQHHLAQGHHVDHVMLLSTASTASTASTVSRRMSL